MNGNGKPQSSGSLQPPPVDLITRQAHLVADFGEGIAPYETDVDFQVSVGASDKACAEHIVGRFLAGGMLAREEQKCDEHVRTGREPGVEVLNPLAAKRFTVTFKLISAPRGLII